MIWKNVFLQFLVFNQKRTNWSNSQSFGEKETRLFIWRLFCMKHIKNLHTFRWIVAFNNEFHYCMWCSFLSFCSKLKLVVHHKDEVFNSYRTIAFFDTVDNSHCQISFSDVALGFYNAIHFLINISFQTTSSVKTRKRPQSSSKNSVIIIWRSKPPYPLF